MRKWRLLLLMLWLPACATTASRTAPHDPSSVDRVTLEPIHLKAVAGPDGPTVVVEDAQTLFERGGAELSERRYVTALQFFDRLLEQYPDSRFVLPALYNAGLSHEGLSQFDRAAERYKRLAIQAGLSRSALDATFRLGACYAELENWTASADVFGEILQRQELSAGDRIEAFARRGYAQFRLGDRDGSERSLREGIRFYQGIRLLEQLDTDFYLAMLNYYYAALPHVTYRELKVAADATMGHALDEKARLLLVAQGRYIKAINVKNPYWATAAGFQIGSLYREFYSVLMTALPDFKAQTKTNAAEAQVAEEEARRLLVETYLEEVHKRVKPLLEKALRVFEKNVLIGERVGLKSGWVSKSRRQVEALRHLLQLTPEQAIEMIPTTLPEDEGEELWRKL